MRSYSYMTDIICSAWFCDTDLVLGGPASAPGDSVGAVTIILYNRLRLRATLDEHVEPVATLIPLVAKLDG